MTILQSGAPKSGNFWLYRIIQAALQKTGRSVTSFIETQPIWPVARQWKLNFPGQARIDVLDITDLQYSYRISSIFKMPVEDIQSYLNSAGHVWTHSPVCKRSEEIFSLTDKIVYIIRDPRDRALSAAKYYCSDYFLKYFPHDEPDPHRYLQKHFDQLMNEWVWHVYDHWRLSLVYNIHIIFYENFLTGFQQELGRLLNYLELELTQANRKQIEVETGFATMKKENPDHLNIGAFGYWKERLSDEQISRADMIAGQLIRALGFPATRNDAMKMLQAGNGINFSKLKDDILQSQEGVYRY